MEPMLYAVLPDISSVCKEFRLESHVWGMSVVCAYVTKGTSVTQDKGQTSREADGQ